MKDQHERDLLPPSGTPTEKFKYERVWFIGRLRDGYNHTCELLGEAKTLLEARDECNSLNSDLPMLESSASEIDGEDLETACRAAGPLALPKQSFHTF